MSWSVAAAGNCRAILRLSLLVALFVMCGCGHSTDAPVGPSDASPTGSTLHSFIYEGPLPATFQESPMLADAVRAGRLPPVEERLPAEPLVIPPVERIGKYGGNWRRAFTGPIDMQNGDRILHDHVIYYDLDGLTPMPHIAKRWEISDDGRVFTFHLREGMKWSDGHPFTADDFLFAYEDIIMNEEICPDRVPWLKTGAGFGRMEKLDDLTIQYEFPVANFVFLELYAGYTVGGQNVGTSPYKIHSPYQPKHHLKQFHPGYTHKDKIQKSVANNGYSNWVELFRARAQPARNADVPTLSPWVTTKPITRDQYVLERNPYYWAVDPEGNQLPYIDRVTMQLAEDPEVLNLRAISGQIDMQHRHIHMAKVPALHENAERGGYRVLLWPDLAGTDCAIYVNQTFQGDPEIAALMKSVDFRKALSLAIDREEINELIFLGTGQPRAFIPPPDTHYYPGSEFERRYAELDRDEANRLLDGLGLEERDSEGLRLRRDGKGRIVISLAGVSGVFLDYPGIAELLAGDWAEIGIKIDVAIMQRSLMNERSISSRHHLHMWNPGGAENLWVSPGILIPYNFPNPWAQLVHRWYASEGKTGVEPTDEMRRLVALYERGLELPLKERIEVGHEIWRIHLENLFVIGTVGLSPANNGVVVVKNNFRNVPDVAPNTPPLQNPGIARPETFFFDR